MHWRNRNDAESEVVIEPGQLFRTIHPDQMVETARVHALSTDAQGIPHVRFSVEFFRSRGQLYHEGPRALSLYAFARRYEELVAG